MIKIRNCLVSLLPRDLPQFIYTKILSPRPLRAATNAILRRMIPERIVLPTGETLLLNQDDPVVSGALSLGAYENAMTRTFLERLGPGMTFVDIGANLGYYTVLACGTVGRIVAFEPSVDNVAILRKNVDANGATNVTVVPSGIGDTVETRRLSLDADNKGKHSLVEGAGRSEEISVTTLDRARAERGIERVDLIKMDIEGWEAHAFAGMRETLRRDRPTIFFEYAPARIKIAGGDPFAMIRSLGRLGYDLFAIDERTSKLVPVADGDTRLRRLTKIDDYVNVLAKADGKRAKISNLS